MKGGLVIRLRGMSPFSYVGRVGYSWTVIDQTKDRRVSADTEAEDDDRRNSEAWRSEELARGVTQM